jgi:hypothetical protein
MIDIKQAQLRAKLAVIAQLGFFQRIQIFIQFLPGIKTCPVNPLQHGIGLDPMPIGPGNRKQFEESYLSG